MTQQKEDTNQKDNHAELKNAIKLEIEQLEKKIKTLKSNLKDATHDQCDKATQLIKDKPLVSIGIAAALGYLIGRSRK
jgi:ElaB/YqjD/DUF883 family membrane-anchored ribosome-binding protein